MQYGLLTIYVASTLLALSMLVMGIYARRAPNSFYFTLLMLAVFILNLGFIFEVTAPNLSTALLAAQVQYFGGPFIAPLFLLFGCEYCGVKFHKGIVGLLMLIPVAACFMQLSYPLNGLYYQSAKFVTDDLLPHLELEGSLFYSVFQAYNTLISVATNVVLIYHYIRRDKRFRRQSLSIVVASLLPILSLMSLLALGGAGVRIDPTPAFLGLACIIFGFSFLRLGFYRVVPIAREYAVEAMRDGFIIMDTKGCFLDANAAAKAMLPPLAFASVGAPMRDILGEELRVDGESELESTGPDGSHRHYRLSNTEVRHEGKLVSHCVTIFDITQTKLLLEEVNQLAETDPLTGLHNRRTLFQGGEAYFAKLGEGDDACMLMLDIDDFKKINDTYGHLKGDEVLVALAEVLRARFRKSDLVARYGGEEFCAFLPEIPAASALEIAASLVRRVRALLFDVDDTCFRATISVGVAVYDRARHTNLEALLADADAGLYEAKRHGKDVIYVARADGADLALERVAVGR